MLSKNNIALLTVSFILISFLFFIPKKNYELESIKKDPDRAYKELRQKLSKKDISTQHNSAHKFGEDLFITKGLAGIHVCDEAFSYACYHGFFSKAVAKNGLTITYKLDNECQQLTNRGRCQHGIGHGILEYFGSDDRIVDALNECGKLKKISEYAGCNGGVYMEYNFRTARARGKSGPRILTKNNTHVPCSFLPQQFLKSCYFYQPQWWNEVFDSDYKTIGQLCAGLKNKELQIACFEGAGNIIGPSRDFKLRKSLEKCQEILSEEGQLYCTIGLARIFATGGNLKEKAEEICSGLAPMGRNWCFKEIQM